MTTVSTIHMVIILSLPHFQNGFYKIVFPHGRVFLKVSSLQHEANHGAVRRVPGSNMPMKPFNHLLLAASHNANQHNKDTEKSPLGNRETYLIIVSQQGPKLFNYNISDNTLKKMWKCFQ